MSNISTALAIADATKQGMYSKEVKDSAYEFLKTLTEYDEFEEIVNALFKYSATLSACVSTAVTNVLLTESQFAAMIAEVNELEDLGNNETKEV
jgi:hypothetical protein